MYIRWYETVLARRQRFEPWRFVLISQLVAWLTYLSLSGYMYLSGEITGVWLLVRALGLAGMVLVGGSYLLSSLCFMWERFGTKIFYQSYLLRVGYFFLLAYFIFVLFGSPELRPFPQYFFQQEMLLQTLLAGVSMVLLSLMMVASAGQPTYAVEHMYRGGARWLGYAAIVIGLIALLTMTGSSWISWFGGAVLVPPASLLVGTFLTWVLVMQGVLVYRLRR